jgi:hypothetical protein
VRSVGFSGTPLPFTVSSETAFFRSIEIDPTCEFSPPQSQSEGIIHSLVGFEMALAPGFRRATRPKL